MTFQFRIWPVQAFETQAVTRAGVRPRLVARWQRGADGHLECRWTRIAG